MMSNISQPTLDNVPRDYPVTTKEDDSPQSSTLIAEEPVMEHEAEEDLDLDMDQLEEALGDASSLTDMKPTTLWGRFNKWRHESTNFRAFILYFVIACDALCFTIIAPFLPEMARERFNVAPERVGLMVGLVSGGFLLARFFSSTYLGHLSDTYGRKWLLILSMFVSVLGTGIFGVISNLYLAFSVRFFEGLISATTVLCKAMIVDISTDENRSLLITYTGSAFAISRSLSSALGGVTVALEKRRNAKNPFLLACLLGAAILLLALILCLLLPETLKKKKSKKSGNQEAEANVGLFAGLKTIYSDHLVRVLIFMFAVYSFCNGACSIVWVLFMEETVANNGLSFSSLQIGIYFTIYGLACFAFQFTCFKWMLKKFGLTKLHYTGVFFQVLQSLIFPLARLPFMLANHGFSTTAISALVYIILAVHIVASTIGFMTLLGTIQSMIANVTDKSRQGLVQGTAQSMATFLRALGPMILGGLFTLTVQWLKAPYLIFVFLAAVYGATGAIGLITFRTKERLDLLEGIPPQIPVNEEEEQERDDREDEN